MFLEIEQTFNAAYLFEGRKLITWHDVTSEYYLTTQCTVRLCHGQNYRLTAYAKSLFGVSENITLVVTILNSK